MARFARIITKLHGIRQGIETGYYPGAPRKTVARIALEHVWWTVTRREWPDYYFMYGADRQGTSLSDVLSYRVFKKRRDALNRAWRQRHKFDYLCVFRDKLLFAQFVGGLGIPTPAIVAFFDSDTVTRLSPPARLKRDALAESGLEGEFVLKPTFGIQGSGIHTLSIRDGRLVLDGVDCTVESLSKAVRPRTLMQERIQQHAALSRVHDASVNTMRLVTWRDATGRVVPALAFVRFGTGRRFVDNWAAGGIIVRVDLATGALDGDGFFKPPVGGRVAHHPDSGARFSGLEIPHYRRAVEMACFMHECLRGLHSVGWDVAIGADNPIFLEGNDDWAGRWAIVTEPNFKRRFLDLPAP